MAFFFFFLALIKKRGVIIFALVFQVRRNKKNEKPLRCEEDGKGK